MLEDELRLPEVTAPVALYLTLLAVALSRDLAPEALRERSRFLDDGVSAAVARATASPFLLVNPIVKRRFVQTELRRLLATGSGAGQLAKALHAAGHHELSREASLCESIHSVQHMHEAEVEGVVGHFENTAEVKWLLTALLNMKDDKVHTVVSQTFGTRVGASVDWDKVMGAVDWPSHWRRLATTLLSNNAVLAAMQTVISNAINAKGVTHKLLSAEYAEALHQIQQARKEREVANREKVEHIVSELSSFGAADKTLDMLLALGVDVAALRDEADAIRAQQLTPRYTVEPEVLQLVRGAVGARHAAWVQAGVMRTPADAKQPPPLAALEEMMRIFVRLTYVPHTGAAAIAQHTRRRIGAIGTKPYQYNVPVELGFMEQYDNLQYKRYDWQGWYQRMVDVHNRNVSIRCRLDDLKRLDSTGAPFVDLQTERRLRIISGDRVGMGVLKLDSDKYEDQKDNITHGTTKLSEIFAESRKAQLGPEYWPSVEVKVRRPSGQSQAYYSIMDNERIEKTSQELYKKYKDAKKRSLFVTPMDMWLEVKGMQVRKTTENQDKEGYSVDMIDAMSDPK
ncbi:hypothetical protein STCU_07462 [Strigomonas culicis]|uniref:Uncharacterized protein n=1 Tax=Strigomonas culicis TaxID=28005 RepID=S9U4S7_9TRYP|nr:hypothetical protein STCU_07462 [Strigomonas culicis]|eukprot:EPY23779.1 hypothetical protein STCU_07462 [Strigomonas culicis]